MVSAIPLCAVFIQLLFICSHSAKTSFKPHALFLPVTKDQATKQYITTIKQRTPLVPVKLTVDLGGWSVWVDCEKGYVSSSDRLVLCKSAQCSLAKVSRGFAPRCGDCQHTSDPMCHTNSCTVMIVNHIGTSTEGELSSDVVSLQSINGSKPGPIVSVPKFSFICGRTYLLDSLAKGVKGMAGLGRNRIALPSKLASTFGFPSKFLVCLGSNEGVIFFGDSPYMLLPGLDVSRSLIYTPLLVNRGDPRFVSRISDPSVEYYIGVKSIKVNGKALSLNTTLLNINKEGIGGTKISSVNPYAILQTSIHDAITAAFAKELSNVPRVKPVAPFKLCYNSTSFGTTRVGPAVPAIDLVLQNEKVFWRIFGANSMVPVTDNVLCLGFVDGGLNQDPSIVIGGHQIEDNLLQFDLTRSRLGFSSSLLFRQTTCSNFNFTSKA